jgi:predicted nucleic acid-binding protein
VILVDTSVWIETFRRRAPLDLEAHVDIEEIVTCLPVVQEVLQGFQDEQAFRVAREAMLAFPIVESPLGLDVVDEAVGLYRLARRGGLTPRTSVDCLIASCAIRHDLEVLHKDRDFELLARVSSLRQRGV